MCFSVGLVTLYCLPFLTYKLGQNVVQRHLLTASLFPIINFFIVFFSNIPICITQLRSVSSISQ